jgi:hypothetical protein
MLEGKQQQKELRQLQHMLVEKAGAQHDAAC